METPAMTTQHTPGPWTISPDGVCIVAADTEYTTAADKDGATFQHPTKLIALPYGCDGRDREANARLIAAAPRMRDEHEATADELQGIAEWLDSIDAGAAIARKLRAIESRHRAILRDVEGP